MKNKKVIFFSIVAICVVIAIIWAIIACKNENKISSGIKQELLRSEKYSQVTENDETVENCEYIKFSSFFTRDLNGDGKAEKLLGSCRNVRDRDQLYIDLNVLTNGYLKNGKITVDSQNFNYSMSMVKDTVLSRNYISDNVREIYLNTVNSGTQKLIIGDIIADVGDDINNYSKVSTVTLTGTHVSDEGVETPINKTIEITVDWHGETYTSLYRSYQASTFYYNYDNLQSETVSFNFISEEIRRELILKENISTLTIPELNGYAPTEVKCKNYSVQSEYNEETRELTIKRNSNCNEKGIITSTLSRYNSYSIEVTYPKEAYDAISSYTDLEIPITSYYTGYNNPNEEFTNPYQSNIAKGKVDIIFRETPKGSIYNFYVNLVDKRYDRNAGRYVISKQDLINLYDSEEEIKNKEYTVRWQASRGTDGEVPSMIMSETKQKQAENQSYGDKWNNIIMEEYVANTGIYFSNADSFLEEDGTISVYNNDTNELIKTFNKEEWNKYTNANPYKYEQKIKHIRVETSKTNKSTNLYVYNIKELETEKILENFTKEQVRNVELVYTYLTGICNIEGREPGTVNDIDYAYYTSERSKSEIILYNDKIPTQQTMSYYNIKINTVHDTVGCAKWKNGEFLLEVPKEIINMEINKVSISNENVKILAYDLIQKDEKYFIKIITENEEETTYTITINCKITPDPKVPTSYRSFKLYSYNEYCTDYYNETQDIYDVNSNNNIEEKVGISSEGVQFLAPTSLITVETISNYNKENKITIAPNVAEVENTKDEESKQKQATINIGLTNNYPNTITGVQIQGKIPFEGNTYILNEKDLKSKFTTTMTNEGITIPEELKEKTTVYYSEKENPTKDLLDTNNGWTIKEDVQDFSKIKTFLIDLKEYEIRVGKEYTFSYNVILPENIDYEIASYSTHAVYYELTTNGGNLSLTTEPNKVGVKLVEKFNLELTKYKVNSNLTIPGVTYSLKYQEEQDDEIKERTNIITTNNEGKINLENLYINREYRLREIKVPDTCELDNKEITFKINTDRTVTINGKIINYNFEESNTLKLKLEDEVKYKLHLVKQDEQGNKLKNITFSLKSANSVEQKYTSSATGELDIIGLHPGIQYTLEEIKANGYYLDKNKDNTIQFQIDRNAETNKLEITTYTQGDGITQVGTQEIQENDNELVPKLNITLQNEKIPTYNLKILKVNKENEPLNKAQFILTSKDTGKEKMLTTNEAGEAQIEGLLEFINGKYITGEYTLKEIYAPEGYSLNKTELKFRATRDAEGKIQIKIISGGDLLKTNEQTRQKEVTSDTSTLTLTILNTPIFNLTKLGENDELLPNAKFAITDIDGNSVRDVNGNTVGQYSYINGKGRYIVKTDENGHLSLNLKQGTYKLEEVEAPEGYELPSNEKDRIHYFGIDKSQEAKKSTASENHSIYRQKYINLNNVIANSSYFVVVGQDGEIIQYNPDGYKLREYKDENIAFRDVAVLSNGDILAIGQNKYGSSGYIKIFTSYLYAKRTISNSYLYRYVEAIDEGGALLYSSNREVSKCDNNGDIVWTKVFMGPATIVDDGIISCHTSSASVFKYDFNGNMLWHKDNSYGRCISKVVKVNDGVVAIDAYGSIIKYNNEGDYLWKNDMMNFSSNTQMNNNITFYMNGMSDFNDLSAIAMQDVVVVQDTIITLVANKKLVLYNNKDGRTIQILDVPYKGIATNGQYLIGVGDGIMDKYSLVNAGNGIFNLQKVTGFNTSYRFEVSHSSEFSDIIKTDIGFVAIGQDGFIGTIDIGNFNSNADELFYRKEKKYEFTTNNEYCNFIGITEVPNDAIIAIGKNGCMVKYSLDGISWNNDSPYYYSYEWKKAINADIGAITRVDDGIVLVGSRTGGPNNLYIGKYDFSGNVRWEITDSNSEVGKGITATEDGVIVIKENGEIAKYNTNSGELIWKKSAIEKGNGVKITSVDDGVVAISSEGEVVKYSNNGDLIWRNNSLNYSYTALTKTNNGIVAVSSEGYIVKYDNDGEIEWRYGNTRHHYTGVLFISSSYNYIVAIALEGDTIELFERPATPIVPETANIEVRNNLLKYNITTEIGVNSENLRTGGSITGEYNDTYKESNNIKFVETVKYGYDNQKAITITPDEGYVIKEIKVNGDILNFIPNEDGSYIIPEGYFKGVTKNYHIVVIFAKISDTLIINKVDNIDKTKLLPGAKFKIEPDDGRPPITNELGSLTNNGTYYFMNENGKYISNNKGVSNTTANSYIPIDLTNCTGKYTVTVNAEISSESGCDIGYATITKDTSSPTYSSKTGQFIYISGTQSAKDYKTILEGGYKYYLHIGYRKDSSVDRGDDRFTINNVKLSIYSDLYEGELTTNANGQIIQKVPFGKYRITELEAPEGYQLDSTPKEVTISEGNCTITIENKKLSKVVVHHYLENTGKEYNTEAVRLAEDEVLEGKPSQEYTTSPNMRIEHYSLLKDENGEYKIPENASGTYQENVQEVFYYYNQSPVQLTVHHYLEGTQDKLAEDENSYYKKGEHYKTTVKQSLLESYELVNVVGDEEKDIMQNEEVTYYYRIKKHNITTKVYVPEGQASKGGTISGEEEKPYETVEYKKSSTKDIIITPETGYRIKQISLVSTGEEGNKTESIIYGENKTENTEITYKENLDKSLSLTKFETMKEDKEVIVQFEPNEGKIIVHHYIENTTEKIYEDQLNVGLVGTLVKSNPVKVENYILIQEPEKREETIDEQIKEITYYYQRQYKITTDLIKYEEPNEQGEMEEVIGGSITGREEATYEAVLKGRNSQKEIEMKPNEGFMMIKVTINGKELDYTKLLKEDGSILLEREYFKNIDEDKHIEVEFRRKTKIHIKYLEKATNKQLSKEEVVDGYVGKYYETTRKNITNYKTAEVGSSQGITNEKQEAVDPNGQMTKDEKIIIYWYEKVPSGILVKHIEKVTTKEINPETKQEETKIKEEILDEEQIPGYAGEEVETIRKEFANYIPAENKEKQEGINVPKDENSKKVTMSQNQIIEVIYWYEREFKITTEVIEHEEKDSQGNIKSVRGGTISGDDKKDVQQGDIQDNNKTPYEIVIRGSDSIKEIKITPDSGYQIKYVLINGKEVYVKDKIQKDKTLTLEKFQNMQEDKHIQVGFERIPAKVIVEYKDAYTKESLKDDKEINGYVNDQYSEQRIEIPGYVKEDPEPQNATGQMTEDTITITYWYTQKYNITTEVIHHEEKIINTENGKEEIAQIKGGSISGETEKPYEIVLKGKSNKKQIIIKPDPGYQIKELKINNKPIEIKDLVKTDGSIELPGFEKVLENKHIQVEFEKAPAKVIIKYLEEGTEKVLYKTEAGEDYEEIQGYVNQEYKTAPKEIKYYELAKDKYPENNKGKMEKELKTVIYYYKKLPFNMKIEKEIENIQLNEKQEEIKDVKNTKLKINYEDIKEVNLEVTYKLKVTNTERVAGKAEIEEQTPEGFEFQKEKSDQRFIKINEKYILQTEEINPGETKEYKVTLKWTQDAENKGEKQNIAKITNTSNAPNFEETTLEDNYDNAIVEIKINKTIKEEIAKMPKTGQTRIIYIIAGLVAGVSLAVIIWNKKENKN